jgi:hypothetical protein
MGWFGKSREEMETERRREEETRLRMEQVAAERETEHLKLVQALDRVIKLSPKWNCEANESLISESTKLENFTGHYSDLGFSASYDTIEGICTRLRLSPCSHWYHHGHSGTEPGYAEIKIFQTKTDTTDWFQIYEGKFPSGYKSYDYITDFMRPMIDNSYKKKQPSVKSESIRKSQLRTSFGIADLSTTRLLTNPTHLLF